MSDEAIEVDEPVRPHVDERGEIALTLGDMTLVMRPSYEAIIGFEAATGRGSYELSQSALAGRLTLAEMAQVACECIRAWGRATGDTSAKGSNPKKIAELIIESEGGIRDAMSTIAGMLVLTVTGRYTSKGELKPTTMTTEPAPVVG
jgi:hypothetical protein